MQSSPICSLVKFFFSCAQNERLCEIRTAQNMQIGNNTFLSGDRFYAPIQGEFDSLFPCDIIFLSGLRKSKRSDLPQASVVIIVDTNFTNWFLLCLSKTVELVRNLLYWDWFTFRGPTIHGKTIILTANQEEQLQPMMTDLQNWFIINWDTGRWLQRWALEGSGHSWKDYGCGHSFLSTSSQMRFWFVRMRRMQFINASDLFFAMMQFRNKFISVI